MRSDENRSDSDVIVIGAGPVGLTTAILLGRAGLRVEVFERWPNRYPLPRACTIDHEALRILQAAGLMPDLAGLLDPAIGPHRGYQFKNAAGALLLEIEWNRPGASGWPQANGFCQPDLEKVLEATVGGLPGVVVHRGQRLVGITQNERGVEVELAREDGTRHTRRAGFVVGADGANSTTRALLGITETDLGFDFDWLVVDVLPRHDRDFGAFALQLCDPAQPTTCVNSGPGRRRWEFMRRPEVSNEQLSSAETAWQLLRGWDITPENAVLERHTVYRFRGRWADRWQVGRVFLAGDAAHLMPPFLGQGLCGGLRDAIALSWRLQLVMRGAADPGILDGYGIERSGHVREIIEQAVELGRVICELDPAAAAERDRRMLAERARPDYTVTPPPEPRLGLGGLTTDHPAAGYLHVQGQVEVDGRQGLLDDVLGPGWQLLSAAPSAPVLPTELRDWFTSIGGRVVTLAPAGPVLDVTGVYAQWFDHHGVDVVLVRPDFYVYGAGTVSDAEQLLRSLRADLTDPYSTDLADTAGTAAATRS